jgi:apolipoprotein N-acyltransferase
MIGVAPARGSPLDPGAPLSASRAVPEQILSLPARLGLAVLSGGLLSLAFPPAEIAGLAWVALAPLCLAVRGKSPGAAAGCGLVAGLCFHTALLWWVTELPGFNPLNLAAGDFFCSWAFAAFGFLACIFHARLPSWNVLTFPVLWVLLEWVRSNLGFLGFPFGLLGYSQYDAPAVAQIARITGVYGVSYLVVAVNAAVVELALARRAPTAAGVEPSLRTSMALLIVTIASVLGLSLASQPEAPGRPPSLAVALVQGNEAWRPSLDAHGRLALLESYEGLTREAIRSSPTLVAWPSGSVPGNVPRDGSIVGRLAALARTSGVWLLVGSSGLDKLGPKQGRRLGPANSAFLFSPAGDIVGRYDKIRLLPFDEYVPLRGWISWPSWVVDARASDFEPGRNLSIFEAAGSRFGVLICWENLFPDLFRRMASGGVEFMVSMTNEAFTDSGAAHAQMLAINVFRAIENGVAIVRTSPTGVTSLIGPTGRIDRLPGDGEDRSGGVGVLVGEVPLSSERTFYTRHGDRFVQGLLVALGALGTAAVGRLRRVP